MTEKDFFEKLKTEGLKGNDYAFKELFNIDNQGNIISSKEGVWFDLRYGNAPFIFQTNIPRAELEKFTPKPSVDESFFNQLKSSDKPSPFTSKGYPFSKDWSSYDSTSLGRAFFSDGIVDGISWLKVYDHISIFDKLGLYLKNEPYFFKKKEISVFVYTADNQEEIKDKYNRLSLTSDELGIFALEKSNSVDFKVKMSSSLFETSRFKTTTEMERFTKTISSDELKDSNISSKWLLDLFKDEEKPLLDPLNVYTKEDFQKYQNPAISTFVKKDFYKSTHRPPMKVKTVDVTLGMFFDGTGNNRFTTELIYNQNIDQKTLILDETKVKKLFDSKKAKIDHPVTKKEQKVEKYMVNLDENTSYLNPYSNVVLLHDLYQSNSDKFNKHTTLNQNVIFKQYIQGIGTNVDLNQNGIATKYYEDDIIGSALARGDWGIIARVEQGIQNSVLQLKKFLEEYNREIRILTIDVFGFSRGSAAARHFIYEALRPEVKEHKKYGLNQQGQTEYITIPAQPKSGLLGTEFIKQGLKIPDQIDIRFTGLFDTVVTDYFTEKVEVNNKKSPEKFEMPEKTEQGAFIKALNTTLKDLKSKVIHIVATDEYRENFPSTVSDAPNTLNLYLYGSHSDIGGGYAETNYRTIIGFKDLKSKTEITEYEKIADSYRRRFAFQKNAKGVWEYKKGQILIIKTDEHKTQGTRYTKPVKLSDHYEIIDDRFISNKIHLVSFNAMLQYALTEKLPFQSDFKKVKNINIGFYEVPKSIKYFMNYYDGIMKMVKNSKDDKLNLAIEDYYPLYQNYIHISSNYNKSAFGIKGSELKSPFDLYVNEPTKNKKRKFLKSTEELDYKR